MSDQEARDRIISAAEKLAYELSKYGQDMTVEVTKMDMREISSRDPKYCYQVWISESRRLL